MGTITSSRTNNSACHRVATVHAWKAHHDVRTLSRNTPRNVHDILNKAIRDGKYLARHMPVLGNVHPIKIENFDIFRVMISVGVRQFPRNTHGRSPQNVLEEEIFRRRRLFPLKFNFSAVVWGAAGASILSGTVPPMWAFHQREIPPAP